MSLEIRNGESASRHFQQGECLIKGLLRELSTVKLCEGSLAALMCVSSRISVSSPVCTDSDGIQSPGSVMSRPQQQQCNYTDPLSILPGDHLS